MSQSIGWPTDPPKERLLVKVDVLKELTIIPDGEDRWLVVYGNGLPPSLVERTNGGYSITHPGLAYVRCSSWIDIGVCLAATPRSWCSMRGTRS